MIRPPAFTAFVTALAALTAAGCLDPRVSDEPGLPGLILPAGSLVPSAHDDRTIDRQIGQNDGVDGQIPLIHGFAAGEPIAAWDLGPAPEFAAPLFVLVRDAGGGEIEPVDHPSIIEAIPGDAGYSPYWAVLEVKVTELYSGELLTSFAAVQEAERLGLVEAPVQKDEAVNGPVVARGVSLEVGGEAGLLAPPSRFFWEGLSVDHYDFGPTAIEDRAVVPVRSRYVLHREGREPLSEVVRGVDITKDGDLNDTNDIFTDRAGQDDFSPLCRTVEVAIAQGTEAIDTFMDQSMSAIRAATDLFDPDAVEGIVIGFQETDQLRNCPQQRTEGGL